MRDPWDTPNKASPPSEPGVQWRILNEKSEKLSEGAEGKINK